MQHYYDDYACYLAERRKDLALPDHQQFISCAARQSRWFRCGCRGDIDLWLLPVELSGQRFVLRRRRKADPHLPGCFAETLESIFETQEVIYTESMLVQGFGLDRHPLGGTATSATNGGPRYEDFVHFLQAQFTRASIESFRAVNEGRSWRNIGLGVPSQSMVFDRLTDYFHEPLLRRNNLSLAAALKSHGLRLIWGVTAQPLVHEADCPLDADEVLEFKVGKHWECHGFQATGMLLEIPPEVLSASRGKAKAMRHVIPPPYLYAALVEPTGERNLVRQLFRIPVSQAGNGIYAVESEAERRCLVALSDAGVPHLKLQVQADLRALGRDLWPFRLDEHGRLPSRPDVFVFLNGKLRIIYLTDSRDPLYHKKVDRSILELKRFLSDPDVLVLKVPAGSFLDGSWYQLLA